MTVSHHIEKSFKMTLFHQIGKHFRNDRAPQYLEMPVLHQIEKNLEMTAPQNWGKLKMTVLHQRKVRKV